MHSLFLLLDAESFHQDISPALALAWRRRSFEPCLSVCGNILSHWQTLGFDPSHHRPEETLLAAVVRGTLPFDRNIWRLLVGEVLLYSAAEIPEMETMPLALGCLLGLAPDDGARSREHFHWIQQVHYGTRDLCFGGGFYRPDHAGYNDTADIARLADCLAAVRPETWTPTQLAALAELETDEDRAEELAYVREWFPALCDLYDKARRQRQVLVCETL
jgi:hypothetical protein